jgi:nucleoside-diphosphate-sugar epimerase
MRVLVTGGSGFVGSHAVAALLRSGRDVRVFARSPGRVQTSLEPLGVTVSDIATGDVTEPASVETAIDGCDAVVHAASVYSLDPRDADRIAATNVQGTRTVLDAARRANIDPVVYVSSYVAFLPSSEVITGESPIGTSTAPYLRSKAQGEAIAREAQAGGQPVTTVSPTSIWGPNDPYCGESCRLLGVLLRNRAPFAVRGSLPITDVRYVAAGLAAAVERGKGPRRYLIGGHDTTWRRLFAMIRGLTGRMLPGLPTPRFMALATARTLDAAQKVVPGRLPFGHESIEIATQAPRTNDARARSELGVEPVPLEETLTDMIRWMVDAGRIPAKFAGDLVSGPSAGDGVDPQG